MGKCATARNKMQYEPVRIGEGSWKKEAAGKWAHVCVSAYLKNDTSQFLSTGAATLILYPFFLFFDTAVVDKKMKKESRSRGQLRKVSARALADNILIQITIYALIK